MGTIDRKRLLQGPALALAVVLVAIAVVSGCSSKPSATTATTRVLLPVIAGGKDQRWGYISDKGAWVIKPQFQAAGPFNEGLAAVELNGKWGYVDTAGKLVVQPQFIEAYAFNAGLARVATKPALSDQDANVTASGYGFIDTKGRMAVPASWDDAGDFSEGLAAVMKGSLCGFVDKTGKLVIPLKYKSVLAFSEGLACAAQNNMWGYLGKDGKWAIQPTFANDPESAGGAGSAQSADAAFDAVQPGIPDELGYAGPTNSFHDGYALVSRFQKLADGSVGAPEYIFIDKSGKQAFGRSYQLAGSFSEGLAPVGTSQETESSYSEKWGFIDTSGRMVIQAQFGDAHVYEDGGFHGGLAPVTVREKLGYIDKTGKFVIQPQYSYGTSFHGGYAWVYTELPGPTTTQTSAGQGQLPDSNEPGDAVYKSGVISLTGSYIYRTTQVLSSDSNGS